MVDDNDANRYYLRALLEGHGWTVDAAGDGAEALVRARRTVPDLVISDLLMPVMDGYSLLREWKGDPRLEGVPFVVYTSTYTSSSDERLALDLGTDAFIVRPVEPDEFMARIGEVMARAATAPPARRRPPPSDDPGVLKQYSEALIRKLEDKSRQLDEMNRALQADILERERAAITLRESEERFRQLAENISGVFWVTDPAKTTVDYVSPGYEKIWGRSAAELRSAPQAWYEAVHPDDRARVVDAARTKQAAGEYDERYRIVRSDGAVRWIRDRAFPIRDAHGEIYRVVGIAEDVSEAKEAEDRLADQAALLDATHEAIVVRDLDDRVIYWNRGAERVYGRTAADVLGGVFAEMVSVEQPQYDAARGHVLEAGDWEGELNTDRADGERRIVEGRWTLVRDHAGIPAAVLAIDSDITERKNLEAQFRRSQRLESIGTLAGGIAHDLNNVLTPIVMAMGFLKELATNEKDRRMIESMRRSAERGADLVRQVLAFARGVEGERLPVRLPHVVQELLQIMTETFPKSIELQHALPEDSWIVIGDPTQLHQVLLNLCVNARDAMPNGGHLSIDVENVTMRDADVARHPGARAGAFVVTRVTDDGTGIAPDVRDRIFDPFFTTKPVGVGTGLGLSTTLAIVRSHGGFMDVETEVGRGTAFTVYLPAAESEPARRDVVGAPAELPRGRGELVLIVDDEDAIRAMAERILLAAGYRALVAANGAEAVSLYARHRREIAVVLTDLAMPVMGGSALIATLKGFDAGVRVVACSGLPLPDDVEPGVAGFIRKPFDAGSLLRAMAQALSAGG